MAPTNGGHWWHRRRNRTHVSYPTATSSGQHHLPSWCHQDILASVRLCGWIIPGRNAHLIRVALASYLHKRQKEVSSIATTPMRATCHWLETQLRFGEKLQRRLAIATWTGIIFSLFIKSCPDLAARGWNLERWTKGEI